MSAFQASLDPPSPSPSPPLPSSPTFHTIRPSSTTQATTTTSSQHSLQPTTLANTLPNLPAPPPIDRVPPPKMRSTHPTSQKFNKFMNRKNKDRPKNDSTNGRSAVSSEFGADEDDDDDCWMLEGATHNGHTTAAISLGRESSDLGRPKGSVDLVEQLNDMPTIKSNEKEKKSKSRNIVKQTSRIFSFGSSNSNGGRGAEETLMAVSNNSTSTSSLGGPPSISGRQSSYSSTESTSSMARMGRNPLAHVRHKSTVSPPIQPVHTNARHISPETQVPWNASTSPLRSGPASIQDSAFAIDIPQPHRLRHRPSVLSASVPGLSRNALPQPVEQPAQPATASRVSAWFSQLLSSSSNEHSPSNDSNHHLPLSPARKGPSATATFLSTAKHKAVNGMRYLFDGGDAQPGSDDPILFMGVIYPAWSPSIAARELPPESDSATTDLKQSAWTSRMGNGTGVNSMASTNKTFGHLFTASTQSLSLPTPQGSPGKDIGPRIQSVETSPSKLKKDKKDIQWPEKFMEDLKSRIWLTYRFQYAPITAIPESLLYLSSDTYYSAFTGPSDPSLSLPPPLIAPNVPQPSSLGVSGPSRLSSSAWNWVKSNEDKVFTTDSGWGCMHRTGQTMLANTLMNYHLGRDWRVPQQRPGLSPKTVAEFRQLEEYANYVRMLSWFLDDPSPLCPFSIHRMTLLGERHFGKDVGEWVGPSASGGSITMLVNSFPICGISAVNIKDNTIVKSEIYEASNVTADSWSQDGDLTKSPKSIKSVSSSGQSRAWGGRPVLILFGTRLGTEDVPTQYYDVVKNLLMFPQSVGIAGGKPGSSYYFIGSQGNHLFYLDPHSSRPTVPVRAPPRHLQTHVAADDTSSRKSTDSTVATDLSSTNEMPFNKGSSTQSSPLTNGVAIDKTLPLPDSQNSLPSKISEHHDQQLPSVNPEQSDPTAIPTLPVDPQMLFYASAYPDDQLRTFHCERVKKLHISGMDPSMLIGFLCRDEADFDDLCNRITHLPRLVFSVVQYKTADVHSEDLALESVSEPELDDSLGGASLRSSISPSPVHEDDDLDLEGIGSSNITSDVRDTLNPNPRRSLPRSRGALIINQQSGDDDATPSIPTTSDELKNDLALTLISVPVPVDTAHELNTGIPRSPHPPAMSRPLLESALGAQSGLSWVEPSPGGSEAPNGQNML